MPMNSTLTFWLEALHTFIPPTGIVLIGVKNTQWISEIASWKVNNVLLFEPDNSLNERLKKVYCVPAHWKIKNKLLSRQNGELTYYYLSNPTLDGVNEAKTLKDLWPNISTKSSTQMQTVTLDSALEEERLQGTNWYVINSFPALPILQGSEHSLSDCDVIIIKAFSDEAAAAISGSGTKEIETWLNEKFFRLAQSFEEDHPKIRTMIFVHNTRQQLHHLFNQQQKAANLPNLYKERDSARRERDELKAKAETLTEDIEAMKVTLEDAKHLRDEQLQAFQALQQRADEAEQKAANLPNLYKERDSARRERDELKAKTETLTEDVEIARAEMQNHTSELNSLKSAFNKLTSEKQEIEQKLVLAEQLSFSFKEERDDVIKTRDALRNQITSLNNQILALSSENELKKIEIQKVEIQIELIQDLLMGTEKHE